MDLFPVLFSVISQPWCRSSSGVHIYSDMRPMTYSPYHLLDLKLISVSHRSNDASNTISFPQWFNGRVFRQHIERQASMAYEGI